MPTPSLAAPASTGRLPQGEISLYHLKSGKALDSDGAALYFRAPNGGDGTTTFALPDLRSRVPVGALMDKSPTDRISYALGVVQGSESVTLLPAQLPAHNHPLNVSNTPGTMSTPTTGAALATMGSKAGVVFTPALGYNTAVPNTALAPASVGIAGSNTPVDVRQPQLALNYIICLEGIFPSRS